MMACTDGESACDSFSNDRGERCHAIFDNVCIIKCHNKYSPAVVVVFALICTVMG